VSPVAVVTGGGSGIGAATAARLVEDGLEVVVTGRGLERLEAVATALGERCPGRRHGRHRRGQRGLGGRPDRRL